MGRELQKKKRRSGRQPVRRKPASKKQILANPIIADNWDSKETLSQNYRRLGLVSKLNKRAGGVQKNPDVDPQEVRPEHPFEITPGTTRSQKHFSEVQLNRDPETGELVVIGAGDSVNPLNDPLNEFEDSEEDLLPLKVNSLGQVAVRGNGRGITRQLEEAAAFGKEKRPRQQSEREEEWIAKLVEKHGDNYAAMFRDRKLNPMQQSIGDLKKRVGKWTAKNAAKAGD